ncbi:MAG: STT3 domain-containing protein [Candidatus Nanohaloarchaea archaeon]
MELDRDKLREKIVQYRYAFPIIAVFLLAVGIRYYPVRNIQYLQALDPYNLFRMSQQIAYEGSRPALDFMRWFPYPTPSYITHIGNIAIPAMVYRFGGFLFFDRYLDFAYFIAPTFAGLSSVGMYFLGKELYDKYTGLAAAFFLAVIPGVLYRSSAGFFEKEAIGTMFMIYSLLFFVLSWKKKSWIYGIGSGVGLGLFTITWGGSQMLWLLYPMIVGFMLLIDRDIENLVAAYTPAVIMAGAIGSIINPGNFWFTDKLFILALAFLALLWARYLVSEFEILSESRQPYFIPSIYGSGSLLMLLSPLYSQTLASIMFSIYRTGTQSGGSVIGGTVAENAASRLPQMVTQLGSGVVDQIIPALSIVASTTGTWTLAFLGVPLMLYGLIMMLSKRYGIIDELTGKENYSMIGGIIVAWALGFTVFFSGFRAIGLIMTVLTSALVFLMVYSLEEESSLTISMMSMIFTAIVLTMYSFGSQNTSALLKGIAYPVWAATAGFGLFYYLEDFKPVEIELKWYQVLPLFWIGSNLLGATARSRLMYLAAFPVALGAGYTFSVAINRLKTVDLSEFSVQASNARWILIGLAVLSAIAVNFLAGFAAAQSIGGSPNQAWMQNLDYLDEQAPNGSTVMSWWDYGYHFQTLGRSASVADGGNFRYYSDSSAINYPLADYFTSNNTENHDEFLEKHSVDYLVLDNTMIGKYQAVSQISRKDNNNFYTMYQASTGGPLQNAVSRRGNRTVAAFTRGSSRNSPAIVDQQPNDPSSSRRQYAEVYVPFNQSNVSMSISDSPTIRYYSGEEEQVNCVLTDEGMRTFEGEESDYCMAVDPYYSFERGAIRGAQTRIVLVPRDIMDHTLVKLYLMDGHDIPYAEKVQEASNDYVEMWSIE